MAFNDPNRCCIDGEICTSLHAEVACVRKVMKPTRYSLLVVNVGVGNVLKNSIPCSHCREYLLKMGFKHIYSSMEGGLIQKLKLKDIPPRCTDAQIVSKKHLPLTKRDRKYSKFQEK